MVGSRIARSENEMHAALSEETWPIGGAEIRTVTDVSYLEREKRYYAQKANSDFETFSLSHTNILTPLSQSQYHVNSCNNSLFSI